MKSNLLKKLIQDCKKVTDLRNQVASFMADKSKNYPNDWNTFQQAYHELFLDRSSHYILCSVCDKKLKFRGLRVGYQKNCSPKCRSNNPETLKKYKTTCQEKYGVDFASQSNEFRQTVKDTCINKYGVDNPFKDAGIQTKYKQSIQSKYGVSNVSKSKIVTDKIRKSLIEAGVWIDDSLRSSIELYRKQVSRITARSYHDHFYKINPDKVERSRYQYHLDHIFSVEEGFKNNISPEIIGHWTNLRMLWHLENSKKNTKCHKSKEKLLEDYQNNHK